MDFMAGANHGGHLSAEEPDVVTRENCGGGVDYGAFGQDGRYEEEDISAAINAVTAASATDININSFTELALEAQVIEASQTAWTQFIRGAGSREAAGEAIYGALFEGAPTLQGLFKTPRAIQASRFMNGLHLFITSLSDPPQLKVHVETIGFGHLNFDVTVARVAIFRDAILDLFEVELGDYFNFSAREGWKALLNYVGGAIIFVKAHYASRLKILSESWDLCNFQGSHKDEFEGSFQHESGERGSDGDSDQGKAASTLGQQQIPQTFIEMFKFNAAVMGFGQSAWMNEVLNCFDGIVRNVANSNRLQQECDVLTLRIANVERSSQVKLQEFKSCMLAALRSLLPASWDTDHEVAWAWLWENTQRILQKNLGKPAVWAAAIDRMLELFDEDQLYKLRKSVFERFFVVAPVGQDFFKQSDTRLHFIIDQIFKMVIDMFHEPVRMCDDISALGLRHAGYGVPTDLLSPFVTCAIEAMASAVQDNSVILEAFSWSLNLISGLLDRTISEGSTIVMKAITANSMKMLRKAVSYAPRGKRASWVLTVQVGTQSISPLYWSIDSGALVVAKAILEDLLTIRADRQKYYYGVDDLFLRHPDIVNRLAIDAPLLLPVMLDGLVWRSRNAHKGLRRTNYYIQNLVQTPDRQFAPVLKWLVEAKDPKLIQHPVIVLFSDTLWKGLVGREFCISRIWLVASLISFMLSQAILPRIENANDRPVRIAIFAGRCFNYAFTFGRLALDSSKEVFGNCRRRDFVRITRYIIVPRCMKDTYFFSGVLLSGLLGAMLFHEPMFWCIQERDMPVLSCEESLSLQFAYSVLAMCAMIMHCFFLVDLTAFNTALSAFLLVVTQVLSEMGRFLTAFTFLLLMFGTSVSVLNHNYIEMQDIGSSLLALFAITLQVYEDDYRSMQDDYALLVAVLLFVLASGVLLLNLLVAQLGCSYEFIYQDSVGFARLKRAQIICETIESATEKTWFRFLDSLKLDQPIEFNEGDVGLNGGIQILEDSSLHPITHDSIYRFGGSCSQEMPWPEGSEMTSDENEEHFDRIEKIIQKAVKRSSRKDAGSAGGVDDDSGNDIASHDSSHPSLEDEGSREKGSKQRGTVIMNQGLERQASLTGLETLQEEEETSEMENRAASAIEAAHFVDKINDKSFDELVLDPRLCSEALSTWNSFLALVGTREKAGEVIYQAIIDGLPHLESLFTSPRAIQAMRFMDRLNSFVVALDDPTTLKNLVETLGFVHLNLDVTLSRVEVFRDSILDLFKLELGVKLSFEGLMGWKALLNYVGGAIMYIKANYAERLSILSESWQMCNLTTSEKEENEEFEDDEFEHEIDEKDKGKGKDNATKQNVPTDFKGMFMFNAAIMGMGNVGWMNEVLSSFDAIVINVANSARLQQECDLLSIKISRTMQGSVNLQEYKSCMLAALRSLLPKVWSTAHELAWAWLWENVERLLKANLGNPPMWEKALDRLLASLDESAQYEIRKVIYAQFFEAAPAGQDYFKQSDTRLHFIADRVIQMTLELFKDPWSMADEISALGLRHVGYDIPTELFGPFVTACINVMSDATSDRTSVDAFRWSLTLISKMLVRTIIEGSTIVMKAINANSAQALQKALSCAPRGERSSWCLVVQVGTQNISPFMWSITSGSFRAADAIIADLLTIRADREKYYYGVEELFSRHPDIIQHIINDAPALLPSLLDGLVWRSRNTVDGLRRVNFYVKHLVSQSGGGVSQGLEWIAAAKDPKIISHPVIVLVSDTLWSGLVSRLFINSKIWFIFSLTTMMMSQAILPKMDLTDAKYIRIVVLVGRIQIYIFTMYREMFIHMKKTSKAFREQQVIAISRCIKIPSYLNSWFESASFILMTLLCLMAFHEPFLWCVEHEDWPTENCPASDDIINRYSVFCSLAMAIHWFMLMDLAVFNTGLSAFVLVVAQIMSEISRFVIALLFLSVTFASAISALDHHYEDMRDIPGAMLALSAITVRLYEHDYRNLRPDPALLIVVFTFVTATVILLLNLLTAQLNCSYELIYQASLGFARLNRAETIVETLRSCTPTRWQQFVNSLKFDQPLEFNEGDVGMSGGLQVQEPAFLNPVTHDSIIRYGGSCSPEMPWPVDENASLEGEEDKFLRLESMIEKAMQRLMKAKLSRLAKGNAARSGEDSSMGSSFMGMSGFPDDSIMEGDEDISAEDL